MILTNFLKRICYALIYFIRLIKYFFLMNNTIKIILSIIALIIFCEYLIYFFVLLQCKWPSLKKYNLDHYVPLNGAKPLRIMIISDTHLLGVQRGHWFDKLRREWQMQRSFQTALFIHNPDVVFILGDVFDEGNWATDAEFKQYLDTYHSMFSHDTKTIVKVVAGNHDMGFHYNINQKKYKRFKKNLGSSTVDLWSINGIHFVLLNSMAFEGDGCFLCAAAEIQLERISQALNCISGSNLEDKANCESLLSSLKSDGTNNGLTHGEYSRPIVLQHFPMFRTDDTKCVKDVDSAPDSFKYTQFRPKWDCLSEDASSKILKKLEPRLVMSGHTHYSCRVNHNYVNEKVSNIPEYSVASFSWRNLNSPSFLLLKVSVNDYEISKCYLPQESTVILLYASIIPLIIVWFYRVFLWSKFSVIILKRTHQKR